MVGNELLRRRKASKEEGVIFVHYIFLLQVIYAKENLNIDLVKDRICGESD